MNKLLSVQNFNNYSNILRTALLSHGRGVAGGKLFLRSIFKDLDEDGNGDLSVEELRHFILGLGIGEGDEETLTLLVDSIDLNRDGIVSNRELEDFIWPPGNAHTLDVSSPDARAREEDAVSSEFGLTLQYVRKAVLRVVGGAAAEGTDEALLAAFGAIAKAKLRHGGLLDDTAMKKAFRGLSIPDIQPRQLTAADIDMLMRSLDTNGDGVVSGKEFKSWLFPHPNHHSSNISKSNICNYNEGDAQDQYDRQPHQQQQQPVKEIHDQSIIAAYLSQNDFVGDSSFQKQIVNSSSESRPGDLLVETKDGSCIVETNKRECF